MIKIATDKAPSAIGPYSQAVVCGGMVYTSGQIAIVRESGSIEASDVVGQTEQVMKNLGEVLEAAGSSYDKAVKTTCFLAIGEMGYSIMAALLLSSRAVSPVSSQSSRRAVSASVSPASMCPFGRLQHWENC